MQLRWYGLQLLVLLITLTAFEGGGTAQQPAPCHFTNVHFRAALINPSSVPLVPLTQECSAVLIGMRGLSVLVTNDNAPMLGFKDRAEASSAQSGVPLEIYLVSLADLRSFDPVSSKVTGLLKEMGSHIYPLQTSRPDDENGKLKTRSALVVSQRKDKIDNTKIIWTPTNWGLTLLAKAMTEYGASANGSESGFFVVWIPALNLHFLGDQLTEDLMLIPLADRKAYGLTKGVPISAKIVFALYAREAKSLDEHSPG